MRFEVPQFIEIEDKIIGPFTWRQFVYLAGGGGIAAVLFFFTNIYIFALFGVPIAILAGLLAFYPINNRPFSHFLEALVTYFKRSQLYLWKREQPSVYSGHTEAKVSNPSETREKLTTLSRRLELESLKKEG